MLYDPKWAPPETEIKLEPWQELMLKAAVLLEEKGWIQNIIRNKNGFCAAGALFYSSAEPLKLVGELLRKPIYTKAIEKLKEEVVKAGYDNVPDWNDARGRTKEQVIAKLREVAGVE